MRFGVTWALGLLLFLWGGETRFAQGQEEQVPSSTETVLDPTLHGDSQEDEPPSLQDRENRFEFLSVPGASPRFQYKSQNGRDPFMSFVDPHDKDLSHLPPLQRVSLSDLKLLGVASSSGRVSAMLQTPDGKSYPVYRGTRVGNNRGRVGNIGQGFVSIEEPYLNVYGRTALRQVVIKLDLKKEE